VRARLGARLRQHLESGDILNQTFAKAFQKFDHFEMRDEASLIHWLSKIAEGQIRDAADEKDLGHPIDLAEMARLQQEATARTRGSAALPPFALDRLFGDGTLAGLGVPQ